MINSDFCPEYRKTAIRAWEFKWEREVSGEGEGGVRGGVMVFERERESWDPS